MTPLVARALDAVKLPRTPEEDDAATAWALALRWDTARFWTSPTVRDGARLLALALLARDALAAERAASQILDPVGAIGARLAHLHPSKRAPYRKGLGVGSGRTR